MFESLIIDINEQVKFKSNLSVKGDYLIGQIYEVLLDANGGENVDWEDVLAVLKYDKALRDKLYIFLASFEEALKADLFRRYDVANRNTTYRQKDLNHLIKNIFDKADDDTKNSNLYYCFELELGPMIELFKSKKIYESDYITKLDVVRVLRNHVMHHNVLLIGKATNYKESQEEILGLEKQLETLYKLLPNDEYKEAFQKAINEQIGRKYMDKIKLREMRNGVFI